MGNFNLGLRLNSLILTINVIILVVVGAIAVWGSNNSLRDQVITRFNEKTTLVANDIDTTMTSLYETTLRLADSLGSLDDVTDATALRTHMLDFIAQQDPLNLIHRISVYRPDESVASLRYINRRISPQYEWRIFRESRDIPRDDARIFDVLETEAPRWFYQQSSYYDTLGNTVLSLATSYYDADGAIQGVLWVDVPIALIRESIRTVINDSGLLTDTLNGYDVLVDDTGQIIADYNLRAPDAVVRRQTAIELSQLVPNLQQPTYVSNDPFLNGEASYLGVRNIPIANWRFVTSFPLAEIPVVPLDIGIPIATVGILGLFVLASLLGRSIRSNIVQPIDSLANAAQEIGSGDMRYIIDHQWRDDVIGRLARALDDMKSNIAHSYGELSRLNRNLEERVRQRTQELEEARAIAIQRADELSAVYDESLIVVRETQLGRVLDALVERLQPLLNVTYCAIWLRDANIGYLQLTSTNHAQHRQQVYIIRDDEGLAGQAIKAQQAIIVEDYTAYPHRISMQGFERGAPFVRAMAVPMAFAGQSIGAIIVGRGEDAPNFTDDEARILGLLANLVSPTVRNAQLFVMTQDAMQEASRANDVKTRFLASVTHELRTPLNLIINNMDFMRIGAFGDVNPEQIQRLNQTVRSSEHLLYLINDLLDVSKIEAGEMQLFIQEHDVYTMLEDSVDNTYALIEKMPEKIDKIELITNIADDLPAIPMDVRRVRQVLTNLLSNAVKFTDEGKIELIVKPLAQGIGFTVRDEGMGIPHDQMDKLFEAFKRTDQARNNNIEGTGLGLPISQYLVQQHGGEITVQSETGRGSTFSFVLPYHRATADDSQEMTRSQIRAMTRSDLFGDVSKQN